MPRVKTIRPGRLTGISGLTTEAARGVKFNKDTEYAYKLEEWKKQNDRIAEVEKEEQDEIRENLKLIAGQDLGEGGFNESVRNQMMDLAVKTARANSKMKLGDLDVMDGAKEVASYDNVLDVFGKAVPNIGALSNKLQEAKGLKPGEVGTVLVPSDPALAEEVGNIVEIVNDMNSPDKNGNVEYNIVNGKSMIKHKITGQEISLQGLNDIMSGENAKYPIKFIETDFTAAAEQPMKNMLKENAKNYTKQISDTVYDADGTKREVIKNVTYTGKGSNYKTDLTALVNVMLDDQKSMPSYWANITGDVVGEKIANKEVKKEPWINSEDQREIAFKLMYDKTDKAWGPKVRSETTSETTVEAKPNSGSGNTGDVNKNKNKAASGHNHNNWIEDNILVKKKQTRYHDTKDEEVVEVDLTLDEKRKAVFERIRLFSPSKFVYGNDPRVDMKSADPNKLYELKSVTGGYNAIEVPISDKDLMNKTKLNKVLTDYSLKYNKTGGNAR